MRKLLPLVAAAALLAPHAVYGGTWAVGAKPGQFNRLAAELPGATTLLPGRALLVRGARPALEEAAYVERLDGKSRRLAFDNTEPFASRQWSLVQDRAWDFWATAPQLEPVRVAVIDSGIDYYHPEFVGRVVAGKSFVGGSWKQDSDGHGTFVAGEIAADPFNNIGIAGMAFNAELLIAKVVKPDGSVSLDGEVSAIRWAVDHGARVINLSLGGVRDPIDARLDTYSPLEQDAVQYAYENGAVLVAAVGNGPQSPSTPWRYADYPAALAHVIGVSALRENGSVPDYSNRDDVYTDLAAPGAAIFSTIPRSLLDASHPPCVDQPYSDCGPSEFRDAIGTSFAAPQVSAAAALILGQRPSLNPDQVAWLLERTAQDATPATGCGQCPVGRDRFTGWGRLDLDAALNALQSGVPLPIPDDYEPNDDAGAWAHPFGQQGTITARLDYWDDQLDVYSINLTKGDHLYARFSPRTAVSAKLLLWNPQTKRLEGLRVPLANRVAEAVTVGFQQRLGFVVPVTGTYFLEAKLVTPTRDPVVYELSIAR